LIVPGTTISLTLMPTFIEVRDKGVIKKKIPLKARSFEDISLELQKYLRYLGKRLAPGVLEETLVRIGLPRARRVLHEPERKPPIEEPVVDTVVATRAPERAEEPPVEANEAPKKRDKKKSKKERVASSPMQSQGSSADEKGVILPKDFDDIADALEAVEALSDSFMAGTKDPHRKEEPAQISINIEGQEEIVASGSTYIRAPENASEPEKATVTAQEQEFVEIVAETVGEEMAPKAAEETLVTITPAHQIKPIKECKALLLGETGVGKRCLSAKAGINPLVVNEETNEASPYIYNRVFDGANYRINLNTWSFDLAVKSKLPRKEFYSNAQVIIIVYATSDRWSFESIDFWLREASISCENNLPIVIVGNKIDLRTEGGDDAGEEHVSHEEGFQFAEELAKRFSTKKELHPVAFIETSCLTGENVEGIFKTAADLFENSLQKRPEQ